VINIQVHGVIGCKWELDKDNPKGMPRVLLIETVTGAQAITLFPVRPEKPVEKVTPPAGGPPIGGGAPAAGTVESYEEPLRVAA
jgi:hypothetical protein